jgi:nitroreductase
MMSDELAWPFVQVPEDQARYLIATAARAPSVQNTQPWRFLVRPEQVELHADQARRLRVDRQGRELLISCGAALFGLRLGVRSLGFTPLVELLPDRSQPDLLAWVRLSDPKPMEQLEREMLDALPHRHTHRGPFSVDPMPVGLVADLQRAAAAEGATLALIDRERGYERLADIVADVSRWLDLDPSAQADIWDWTRGPDIQAGDGVPAEALTATAEPSTGRLPQRDFDLGRGIGQLDSDGPAPAVTAVLTTPGDSRGDWLCAGQALHRVLLHAASQWVFASLHTQPLEDKETRALIADRLALPGAPQLILQLGPAEYARATPRRSLSEIM